jgi:hypothetical protein
MTPGNNYALANPIYMDAMRDWTAIGRSHVRRSVNWKMPVGSSIDLIMNWMIWSLKTGNAIVCYCKVLETR